MLFLQSQKATSPLSLHKEALKVKLKNFEIHVIVCSIKLRIMVRV